MHRGGTLQEPEIRLYSNPEVSLLRLFPGGRLFRFTGQAVFYLYESLRFLKKKANQRVARKALFCVYLLL